MKRATKETKETKKTKKNLAITPKKKTSEAENLSVKAVKGVAKKKFEPEIKTAANKSVFKNSPGKSKPGKQSATRAENKTQPKKIIVKQPAKDFAPLKPAAAALKSAASKARKKSVGAVKTNKKIVSIQTKRQLETAVKIDKSKAKKTAPVVSAKDTKSKKKIKTAIEPKIQKTTPAVDKKTGKPKTRTEKIDKKPVIKAKSEKAKSTAPTRKTGTHLKTEKAKTIETAKIAKPVVKKSKSVSAAKIEPKLKSKVSVKRAITSEKKAAVEKIAEKTRDVKIKVEAVPKKKVLNKKVKPIGSAVFRGKKEKYDFQVFALDEKFEPIKAVYIISKRKTDRKKRGHHKLVCIGETESIVDGIRQHKKDKCIKHNDANVICLLKEEDEKSRLRIAADLREAHIIVCKRQ